MTSSSYGAAWCLKSVAVSFDGIQVSLRLQPSTRCRLSVTTFAEEDTPTFWQHFFILSHYFPFSLVSGALFSHFILSHCFLFLTGERRSLLPLLSGSLLSLLFWIGAALAVSLTPSFTPQHYARGPLFLSLSLPDRPGLRRGAQPSAFCRKTADFSGFPGHWHTSTKFLRSRKPRLTRWTLLRNRKPLALAKNFV